MDESARSDRAFRVWYLVVPVAALLVAGLVIRERMTVQAAKGEFFDSIERNDVPAIQDLLNRYPSLLRSESPALKVPGDLSIYTHGETPLGTAVMYDSRNAFDYLLSLGPDVDAPGGAACPALIWAVCRDDIYYLEMLLRSGADPSVRDVRGKTAADYARQFGKPEFLDRIARGQKESAVPSAGQP